MKAMRYSAPLLAGVLLLAACNSGGSASPSAAGSTAESAAASVAPSEAAAPVCEGDTTGYIKKVCDAGKLRVATSTWRTRSASAWAWP